MNFIKKSVQIAIILLTASILSSNAQNTNAILFTENGERFTAILNGLRQNDKPETNVKIQGLNANTYKLKVIFEDLALGQSNFNLFLEPGTESTFVIKKNNKNAYVLRPISSVPIADAPPSPASTQVVTYNPSAPVYVAPAASEQVTQQTTITTTTSEHPQGNAGISMGINVNEAGGNFSMNVSGIDNSEVSSTQHTTITTTTTTTSSSPAPSHPAPPVVYVPGYTGAVGCPMPMSPPEFESMKSSIASKTFEESKMTIAKQVTGSHCLTAQQVKDVVMLFTFEQSKLDFAKFAYGKTYDLGNYFKVNDAFEFESSIDELNDFINSRH